MDFLIAIAYLIGGFLILIIGGEGLVKSAVSIAGRFKVSPAVVGLTIVAAGTSAPELLTSIVATLNGTPDIAIGNVIGSNTFNILAILGITALLSPLYIDRKIFKNELIQLAFFSLVFLFLIYDTHLDWVEGAIFITMLMGSLYYTVHRAKDDDDDDFEDLEILKNKIYDVFYLCFGMGGLILGAELALQGGTQLGHLLGFSEKVIGIAIISVGTGLPELVTSAVASFRQQNEIAFSNVIGSNIMNTLAVTGAASIISPITIQQSLASFDALVMVAVTIGLLPFILLSKFHFKRTNGFVLLTIYIGYITYLIQN